MTGQGRAVESDGLWKAPSDLPTGLGKRGPSPVFHSYTQPLRRGYKYSLFSLFLLPMSLDYSVTYLPDTRTVRIWQFAVGRLP